MQPPLVIKAIQGVNPGQQEEFKRTTCSATEEVGKLDRLATRQCTSGAPCCADILSLTYERHPVCYTSHP